MAFANSVSVKHNFLLPSTTEQKPSARMSKLTQSYRTLVKLLTRPSTLVYYRNWLSMKSMSPITVTERDILKLLQGLKLQKAAGLDKVPTRLIELGAQKLTPDMTKLYQLSLDQGKLPSDWKTATV